nr:MAG: capsid protein [Crogonang virus 179]
MIQYSVPGSAGADVVFATTPLSNSILSNGTISVYVVNDLSLPSANSTVNNSIGVNVFVSMGSDFRVFNPSPNYSLYSIHPQSTGIDVSTEVVDAIPSSGEDGSMVISIEDTTKHSSKLSLVFSGEELHSFRDMLKRYYPYMSFRVSPAASSAAPQITTLSHRIFPIYRGVTIIGIHKTAATLNYNYCYTTLLNYLAPAFNAFRGSIRYKAIPRFGAESSLAASTVSISHARGVAYGLTSAAYSLASSSSIAHSGTFLGAGLERSTGVLPIIQSVNPIVEYEVPWWEKNRYAPGKLTNFSEAFSVQGFHPASSVVLQFENRTTQTNMYDLHVCAGEDFSCYFFTGWPPLYYVNAVPAPSLVADPA